MQIYKLHVLLAKIPVLESCNFIINRLLHRCFPVIWKFYTSRQLFKSVSIRGNTTKYHYKKSVRIQSFSSSYFPACRLNKGHKNFEYGHFPRRRRKQCTLSQKSVKICLKMEHFIQKRHFSNKIWKARFLFSREKNIKNGVY